MREIFDIVKAYKQACEEEKLVALATVVKVEGSAYRRPGARMLITEDGQLTGAISGGCLEGDALKKALLVMHQKKAMLVKYDTSDDDDAKLGVGLGCNGIIHILIEPIIPDSASHPILFLQNFLQERKETALITLFNPAERNKSQLGTCLLLKENQLVKNENVPESLEEILIQDARNTLETGNSCIVHYQDKLQATDHYALIEALHPAIVLNIAGAGNDVMPLVTMASVLGWQVNVVDGRPGLLNKQRFPSAKQLIVSKADQILEHLQPDAYTVFALMSHNYNYDLNVLKKILKLNIPYIGVLGPKKKLDRILQEVKDEGLEFSSDDLAKIYGPVGLDIGAETSEEIALSVLAEIKAVLSKKKGTSLKDKQGPIHDTISPEHKSSGITLKEYQA